MTSPNPARDEAVPTGWKLVPIEATREMYKAANEALVPAHDAAACWEAMLASAPAPASGRVDAVAVKALEWNPFSAETVIGRYDIVDQSDASYAREREGRPPFLLAKPRAGYTRFDTLAEARAAAQADYETRIRSALSPAATPVSGAGGEAVWRSIVSDMLAALYRYGHEVGDGDIPAAHRNLIERAELALVADAKGA